MSDVSPSFSCLYLIKSTLAQILGDNQKIIKENKQCPPDVSLIANSLILFLFY